MNIPAILAQTSTELNPTALLVGYGPLGVFCVWFMFRVEKLITAVNQSPAEFQKSLQTLSHRIDGITRAMLLEVASREGGNVRSKQLANEMLAKIEARSETE